MPHRQKTPKQQKLTRRKTRDLVQAVADFKATAKRKPKTRRNLSIHKRALDIREARPAILGLPTPNRRDPGTRLT